MRHTLRVDPPHVGSSMGSFLQASLPGIPDAVLRHLFACKAVRQRRHFKVWDSPVEEGQVDVKLQLPGSEHLVVEPQAVAQVLPVAARPEAPAA